MKLKSGIVGFAVVFLIVISCCHEDLEKENEELWARLGELQEKIDELNSIAATKDEMATENTELEQEIAELQAELQAELDNLNSIVATRDELSAENALSFSKMFLYRGTGYSCVASMISQASLWRHSLDFTGATMVAVR